MYHYTECGLSNIWISNGYTLHPTPYGEAVGITDADGLDMAIARHIVETRAKLTGTEFRFLRKQLGLSQSALARMWGYEEQTIAGWEKRGRTPKIADRFIRAYWQEAKDGNAHIIEIIERLQDMDYQDAERIILEDTQQGWRMAA